MNAKERVMRVLNQQKPDRMPCFGANSTVTYDQMEEVQAYWPEAHFKGEAMAKAVASDDSMNTDTTAPGEGPSQAEREAGFYDLLFIGETGDGESLCTNVKGDMDPGYGSTSKMIAEAAICLAENPDMAGGGIWTPAPAMGEALIERLEQNAGISFELEALA